MRPSRTAGMPYYCIKATKNGNGCTEKQTSMMKSRRQFAIVE
jgi:hypothetical protein